MVIAIHHRRHPRLCRGLQTVGTPPVDRSGQRSNRACPLGWRGRFATFPPPLHLPDGAFTGIKRGGCRWGTHPIVIRHGGQRRRIICVMLKRARRPGRVPGQPQTIPPRKSVLLMRSPPCMTEQCQPVLAVIVTPHGRFQLRHGSRIKAGQIRPGGPEEPNYTGHHGDRQQRKQLPPLVGTDKHPGSGNRCVHQRCRL